MKIIDISKKINQNEKKIKELGFNDEEIDFLRKRVSRNKNGFIFDFKEFDTNKIIQNNYFVFEEKKELNINIDENEKNNNLFIEGDNLEALIALKATNLKVDVIYVDPPYNTKNKDFIYSDDYSNDPKPLKSEDPHKHSKWLSFMKKRLNLARKILNEEGIIFVSIDDHEQAYLKIIMDDIFGEENFVSNLHWVRNPGGESDNKYVAKTYDFILFYAKNKSKFKIKKLEEEIPIMKYKIDVKNKFYWKKGSMLEKGGSEDDLKSRPSMGQIIYYKKNKDLIFSEDYDSKKFKNSEHKENITIENKIYSFNSKLINEGYFPIIPRFTKNTYGRWRMTTNSIKDLYKENLLIFSRKKIKDIDYYSKSAVFKELKNDFIYQIHQKEVYPYNERKAPLPKDWIDFTNNVKGTLQFKKIFPEDEKNFKNPKPSDLIKYLINFHNNKNAVVLDFFAGTGTTGQAVMELNNEDQGKRRFILVNNNENVEFSKEFLEKNPNLGIARQYSWERIFRVINGEGSKREKIDWFFSPEKKFFSSEKLRYFLVKKIHKINGQFEEINSLKKIYKNEFMIEDFSIEDLER